MHWSQVNHALQIIAFVEELATNYSLLTLLLILCVYSCLLPLRDWLQITPQ